MINRKSVILIIFIVTVSLLMISGCINSTQQGTTQPTPIAPVQTQNPIVSNNYLEEVKANSHAFGPSNSSSSTSIYISSGQMIYLIVPLMLDENGNILKMFDNPIISGNLTTSMVNTEYGKALRINGTGGEIRMIQDDGLLASLENESRFLDGFTITMSNNTVIGLDTPFTYQALVYSGNDVQDFRLIYSRSGGQSGKLVYVRTGNQSQPSEISTKLGKGWLYINLYGDIISVK